MKTAMIATTAVALLLSSALMTSASANIVEITAEREARTAHIVALKEEVRVGRMTRSEKVKAINEIARLEAEVRKERRQQDRIRDRLAALKAKH